MHIETLILAGNGWVPNNPRLPVRIYRAGTVPLDARGFEQRFAAHGWPPRLARRRVRLSPLPLDGP